MVLHEGKGADAGRTVWKRARRRVAFGAKADVEAVARPGDVVVDGVATHGDGPVADAKGGA